MRKKKVFIGLIDVGTNQNLKNMIEEWGYEVVTCGVSHRFGFKNDINLDISQKDGTIRKIRKAAAPLFSIFKKILSFDIFHFRGGISFLPLNLDLPILKILNKKIIMHFDGTDIRQLDRFDKDKYNKILVNNLGNGHLKFFIKRVKYHWIKNWVDKIIVASPDLLEFAPEAEFIPNFLAYKTENLNSDLRKKNFINILHAPSSRITKGTEYFLKAIKRLQKEKYPVKLNLLENISRDQIWAFYRQADIIIDQLLIGAYGVVSIEGMSFGKPVICYIREDLRKYYAKDLPIISANPDNIYEVLKRLIENPNLRLKIGKKSTVYFNKFHSQEVMSKKWLKIYQNL